MVQRRLDREAAEGSDAGSRSARWGMAKSVTGSSGADGAGAAEKQRSLPASLGADGSDSGSSSSWVDAQKAVPGSSGAAGGAETRPAFRGAGAAPKDLVVPRPYPAPYSPPPNPADPKLQKMKKDFFKDEKRAFAELEKEDGKTTKDWLMSSWSVAEKVAKAKEQDAKARIQKVDLSDDDDEGGASSSAAASSVPKAKTEEEMEKRRIKRAKQSMKKDIRKSMTKELGRVPTDKEVEARMEQEKGDLEKAIKIKGLAQPKPQLKEVTYSGVLGDAKAGRGAAEPDVTVAELEGTAARAADSADDETLFLPWSVVQRAKEAFKQNPDLASEIFKEEQAKAYKRSRKDSDDDSSGTDNNDPDNIPKNRLSCCNSRDCGNDNLLWSQFLLIDAEEADWQGYLWGTCQECSELDKKTFKKLARKRKEVRAEALRGKRNRARMITLLNAKKVIAEMFPKASQKLKRELAIARTMALASAGTKIFDKMSSEAKIASDANCQRWLEMVEKNADDPSMACPIDAWVLTATECSYLANTSRRGGASPSSAGSPRACSTALTTP